MQQTGTLLPGDYWPNLQLMAFWLSASVGHYIKDVRPLIQAATVFFDAGYGSSEARINIPSRPEDPAGTLSIYTAFYEFLPAHGGFPLLAHQLSDGQWYEIIVTTWSGLYRYNLKDTIMVKGFTGGTPNIVFQYKTGEVLNIAEEKVPASLVNDSIREVAPATGIDVVQIQIYAHQEERRYICYLEPTGETVGFDAQRLSQLAHKQVSKNCFAYDVFCNQQNLIHPLQIVEMKTGWQNHLYQTRIRISGSATQVKLPVMITEQAADEWIR
jgi:hypothetical protein